MRRIYYRTVKRNRIKLLGKVLRNEQLNNGELDGKRFCFIPHNSIGNTGFDSDGLTALWRTQDYSLAVQKNLPEKELAIIGREDRRILAPDGVYRWDEWCESCY